MKWQLGRLASAAAIGIVATTSWALAADPPKSIKIGYVVSLSGVNAQGAAVTTLPAYKLWVDDVNKKGGLMIKEFNKRIPVEVVEYDDTSNAEAAVRLTSTRWISCCRPGAPGSTSRWRRSMPATAIRISR